jgi:hypothetical protein
MIQQSLQLIYPMISQSINIIRKNYFFIPCFEFSDEDINYLGINCSGTDLQRADCIKSWQEENIIYDAFSQDSSYSIRWNHNFPGIYPSSEIIREKINDDGKIYGVCFDYAVIYCSIAEYYGIECRVMNSITKPSDRDSTLIEYASGLGVMNTTTLK